MTAAQTFVVAIVAVGLLVAGAIFTIAYRRGPAPTTGRLSRKALRRERRRAREAGVVSVSDAHLDEEGASGDAADAEEEPGRDPLAEREPVSVSEFNTTRRQFFNRSLLGLFGLFLGQFALGGLAFFWPKLSGGFGTPINAGSVVELRTEILQPDGSVVPFFLASAQSWVVPFRHDGTAGTSFEGLPVIAGGEGGAVGLMALWQRCVHLGCRVPSCVPSQGFECPCHGSKYNLHGEYEAGPAPRNMDRFVVSLNDNDEMIIETGQVIQTARASNKTIQYPQGPFCV